MKKRRIYLILILLLYANLCFPQSGGIKIYIKNFCKDTVYLYDFITINNSQDSAFIYDCNNGKGLEEGEYRLSILEIGEITIKINNNKNYIDTFYFPSVNELFETTSNGGYYGFYHCNEPCQGKITDYFKSGVKRLEGNFKDGLPIGELKTYYPNGNIMEIREYTRLKRLRKIIHFDKDGKQIKVEEKGHKVRIIKPSAHNRLFLSLGLMMQMQNFYYL